MIEKIPTLHMSRSDWLLERRGSIGGSDAGAILGLNPYRSPYTVWAEKTGRLPEQEDNEAMRQGRDLEDYVAQRFAEKSGKRVERYNYLLRNTDAPYLTPQLLRVLKPGRVFACHVKDRVLFGNATGMGMPTMEPFHAQCIQHYMSMGFAYFGMITVVTDVVRENNQTYRLGWTEQCKDGSKMGVGCPEYILLFRKLPTDRSKAYADEPVRKTKEQYTRAQWQLDAHGFWRSSGDRLMTKSELERVPVDRLQAAYRKYSRDSVYSYEDHVALAKKLDQDGHLPATFMVVAPGSWTDQVWDDINRMRTLNTSQSQRRKQMHVCPLQLDIVDRLINRYSNPGDLVLDPFGGLGTVALEAVKAGRRGYTIELNSDYFRDAVGYLKELDETNDTISLFDMIGGAG